MCVVLITLLATGDLSGEIAASGGVRGRGARQCDHGKFDQPVAMYYRIGPISVQNEYAVLSDRHPIDKALSDDPYQCDNNNNINNT